MRDLFLEGRLRRELSRHIMTDRESPYEFIISVYEDSKRA